MRNWIKRILGREGKEESARIDEQLNYIEAQTQQFEKRVQHLRRERLLYERQQRERGAT